VELGQRPGPRENALLVIDTSYDRRTRVAQCLINGFIKQGKDYRGFEERHIQRAYPVSTLDRLLRETGFTFPKYDGYSFTSPRKDSGRLVYVCLPK